MLPSNARRVCFCKSQSYFSTSHFSHCNQNYVNFLNRLNILKIQWNTSLHTNQVTIWVSDLNPQNEDDGKVIYQTAVAITCSHHCVKNKGNQMAVIQSYPILFGKAFHPCIPSRLTILDLQLKFHNYINKSFEHLPILWKMVQLFLTLLLCFQNIPWRNMSVFRGKRICPIYLLLLIVQPWVFWTLNELIWPLGGVVKINMSNITMQAVFVYVCSPPVNVGFLRPLSLSINAIPMSLWTYPLSSRTLAALFLSPLLL